jgi:hypothetical protein
MPTDKLIPQIFELYPLCAGDKRNNIGHLLARR